MVSFIVPVYKVEKYLSQCVESLLSQTYTDFEIILVDDGSPDNCPVICDEWARKDHRVKAVHKTNGGLSDARNYGVKFAGGGYLIFVDSDDFWCSPDSLMNVMAVLEKYPECDFLNFNCSYFYPDENVFKKWVAFDDSLTKPVDKNTALCSLVSSGTMPMSAWMKVISRQFFLDNNLYFIKGLLGEDIPWFINLLDCTNKCIFVNEYVYAYRQNVSGSITNSGNFKSVTDLFGTLKDEVSKVDSRSFSRETKDSLYSFLAYEFCILLTSLHRMPKDMRTELLRYKWLLNYTDNPKVRKAAHVNKYFGIRITEYVLRFYLRYVRK